MEFSMLFQFITSIFTYLAQGKLPILLMRQPSFLAQLNPVHIFGIRMGDSVILAQVNFYCLLQYLIQPKNIQLMKKQQAVVTDQKMKQYMEKNKVRSIFGDLVRQVVLKRPDNPIEYLINYLDKRPRRLLVCLQGYDDQNRKRLAKIICNKLNFKLIELSDIYSNKDYHLESDAKINEKVLAELKASQSVYKGIIVSGYPNNIQQVDFIQKSGFLPDRYFTVPFDSSKIKETLKGNGISEEQVNNILKRHSMEKKQLVDGLGQMLDSLPLDVDEAAEILTKTLNIKVNKKTLPYQSPRIVFVYPPYLQPRIVDTIVRQYTLHPVNVQKTLRKLCKKQNFKDYVEKYVRKNGGLSKQIELALLETECKSAAAKNKGYLLSGWPTKKQHLAFLKERHLSPHLIFVFDLDQQACEEQFQKLEQGDPQIFQASKKPSLAEYSRQLSEYYKLVDQLKQHYKIQILPWAESQKQVLKTFESLIDNPKVYS